VAKILLPFFDAAEVMDTLYPYLRVREVGHQAVIAAPARRTYGPVIHEIPPGWDFTRESTSYHLASEIAFSEVQPDWWS